MEGEVEAGDDTEVATPATQCPQELGVLGGGGLDDRAVPAHDLGRHQVVARESVLAFEPAGAATERETGDPGGRDTAAGGRETMRLRGTIHVGPDGAAADAGDAALGVDRDVGDAADVDHHAVVAQGQPGDGMSSGSHGDRQVVVPGERENGDHVVDDDALGHEARPAVDHRVEQRAGVLVVGIAGLVQATVETEAELVGGGERGGGLWCHTKTFARHRPAAHRRFRPSPGVAVSGHSTSEQPESVRVGHGGGP
jgi:hypothetical protein